MSTLLSIGVTLLFNSEGSLYLRQFSAYLCIGDKEDSKRKEGNQKRTKEESQKEKEEKEENDMKKNFS